MEYTNNHFVPQLILRRFGKIINTYNIKTKIYSTNQETDHIFSEKNLYSVELEQKFHKLENDFAKLLDNNILHSEKQICLKRKQIWLIKQFLIISMIRVEVSKSSTEKEKTYFHSLKKAFPETFPFVEKDIENESIEQRWERNLNLLLECENLEGVSKHPNATYEIFHWVQLFNLGYLVFWDSGKSGEDFIVTDIGMTSENEIGWSESTSNLKKTFYLLKKLENTITTEQHKAYYKSILLSQMVFHENFMLFSISNQRTIALINPFFRLYFDELKINLEKPNIKITLINDINLLEKNKAKYQKEIQNKTFLENDDFEYKIQYLNKEDVIYCNMLLLDRIDNIVGFSDIHKIRRSLFKYNKLCGKRNDYSKLLEFIK